MAYQEEIGEIPHLADFTFHKTLPDIDFDAVPIPGLDADFYRRPVGDRLLSVGVYRFRGTETHRAWGWVGEAHCSWHAYRNPVTGGFDGPFEGCPEMRLLLDRPAGNHAADRRSGVAVDDAARAGARLGGFELGSGGLARQFLLGQGFSGPLQPGHPAGVDDRRCRDREAEEQPAAREQRRGAR